MSKRNKVVIETQESKTLKDLRIMKGLSLQDVADLLELSKQQVHIMESGRANISRSYVDKFLKALDFTREHWHLVLGEENSSESLARKILNKECMAKIEELPEEKLKLLHSILNGL